MRGARRLMRQFGSSRWQIDGTLLLRAQIVEAIATLCGRRVADGPVADLAEADSRKALADPLRSASILVAEDNEVNQEVIRRQLTPLGFRHEIASTGADALRRISGGSYTLLITDLHMPVMDGYELTTQVREREAATGSPRMPIIAITANALKSEAERCISVGMDDYTQ
jgi:CheY-like chemotaxis protein